MQDSVLTKEQKKEFSKTIMVDGKHGRINATVSFDDARGNGQNTFSITGTIYQGATYIEGGCIHDEIAEHFPTELAHLLKWHLSSTDGIWNYPDGVLRYAADRTHPGVGIGEPVAFDTKIEFFNHPYKFAKYVSEELQDFLASVEDYTSLDVIEVPHKDKGKVNRYQYPSSWSLSGLGLTEGSEWANAPFRSETQAHEFLNALISSDYQLVEVPTKWCEPLEPNIEKAKEVAMWLNATLEELQNKAELMDRVPVLMEQFRADIEELGFTY